MKKHFDILLGFTIREYEKPNAALPFLQFQIGEMRNVHRSAPALGRTLPVGYEMTVPVFWVHAFGKTLAAAKAKLNHKK